MAADVAPKLFISYSWTTPEHEEWVLRLATELRQSGVDVVLDKWDLKEGQDAIEFMEKMVNDPNIKKVALICDRAYKEKANGRKGGVGTETQIITTEIYTKIDQNKFVLVSSEKDKEAKAYRPVYYKNRIYIDLSDDDLYAKNFEQLLRWIFDKPLYEKPELGKKPAFLSDIASQSLGTTAKFRRVLDAIRNNKAYWKGALIEFFDTYVDNLEKFRLKQDEPEIEEKVMQSIEEFLPFRNEAIEIFLALAQYVDGTDTNQRLHRFFEGLIPYLYRPKDISSYRECDFDNYRLIIHELFLYAIASLLKYECYGAVTYLLGQPYYYDDGFVRNHALMFSKIYARMESLEKINRPIRSELLKQRAEASGFDFQQIMQADFVLFIRDCLDGLRYQGENPFPDQNWWPSTLLFIGGFHGAFPIFARAASTEYFNRLKSLFCIDEKKDFEPLFEAIRERRLFVPIWGSTSFNPSALMGYNDLATRL